jgi:hypothetical protein
MKDAVAKVEGTVEGTVAASVVEMTEVGKEVVPGEETTVVEETAEAAMVVEAGEPQAEAAEKAG